jgi:type III pantothenate kinase
LNYLIIDIGNTNTDFIIFNRKNNKHFGKLLIDTNKITKNISKINNYIKKYKPITALTSSVVPKSFEVLKSILNRKKINLTEIKNKNVKIPLNVKLKNPNEVGSDRIANSVAAFKLFKTNSIVIDFGTATTFDVIVKNNYLGGMITPGINLSLNVLKYATAKLPLIKLKKTSKYIGKNTVSAMNNGMFWGYIGLIKELVRVINKETRNKFTIIFTGGLAHIFFKSVTHPKKIIDHDITLKGIIEILKLNYENIK